MKTNLFLALFVSSAILPATGCGGAAAPQNTVSGESADSASIDPAVVGDFSRSGTALYNELTLNADGTFKGVGGCDQSGPGPHCFAIFIAKGTWTADGETLSLKTPGVTKALEYSYSFDGQTLTMTDSKGTVSTFVLSQPAVTAATIPAGTYVPESAADRIFNSLVLNADGSYRENTGCPTDGSAPHCFAEGYIDGTWSVAGSELTLVDSFGGSNDVWTFTVAGSELTLESSSKTVHLKLSSN